MQGATIGRPWTRRYVVFVLTLASFLSYVDRQAITILLEPIKSDLGLSDTELGMLTGVLFSALFVVAGIPLGRLADSRNRKNMIATCLAAWSLATIWCSFVQSYVQLAVGRTLVAIGEAGSFPASASLVANLIAPGKRTGVFALISAGGAAGGAAAVYLGGLINQHYGWRSVFLFVGLPGLLFSLLIYFTVPEPARPSDRVAESKPTLMRAVIQLWRLSTYRALAIISIFASISAYAVLAWMPTFLIRVHGMSTSKAGAMMGTAIVLGLMTGNIACSLITDRLGAKDVRWLMWLSGCMLLACFPLAMASLFWSDGLASVIILGFYMFAMGFWSPASMAVVVGLVGSESRGLAASTMPLYQAIGGALGPFIVGVLNDVLAAAYGSMAIRYSIAVSLIGLLVSAAASFAGGRTISGEYGTDNADPSQYLADRATDIYRYRHEGSPRFGAHNLLR